jgi:hypothetical protein
MTALLGIALASRTSTVAKRTGSGGWLPVKPVWSNSRSVYWKVPLAVQLAYAGTEIRPHAKIAANPAIARRLTVRRLTAGRLPAQRLIAHLRRPGPRRTRWHRP